MVLVAVAGGTSPTLGRSIVKAILAQAQHDVIILSRKGSTDKPETKYNAPIKYVDYDSVPSLSAALEGVHTVVSVLKVVDPNQMVTYHSNLLDACLETGVTRYAPSHFSLGSNSHVHIDLLANKNDIWDVCGKKGIPNGIECAMFQTGGFLNYFGQGKKFPPTRAGQEDEEFVTGGLQDDMILDYIDIANQKLVVPLNEFGQPARVTMTHLNDIGTFVAAALDLPPGSWNGHMGIEGCTFTLADIADIINNHTQAKVKQETITMEECDARIKKFDAELAEEFKLEALIGRMVAQMVKCMCLEEVGLAIMAPDVNGLCPDIKPMRVEDYLIRAWGRR